MDNSHHIALYRKWRPATFDEVRGQDHITSVLKYETSSGLFSHAYLFCGSRGTGKTSCAKILAKAVNCLSPENGNPCGKCESCRLIESGRTTDVLEMDAASNNGVDNVRDIIDEIRFAPSALKYRVYIVDEVHMLSASAFNALLKTLEEPPAHVIFILATTELHKLPATIISRCQRFDFRRIGIDVLTERLTYIAEKEKISITPEAARLISVLAQGGMRDAISMLEMCSGGSMVTVDSVNDAVGSVGRNVVIKTVRAIRDKDYETVLKTVDEIVSSAKDLGVFWQELISLYRDMLIYKSTGDGKKYLDLTDEEDRQISAVSSLFTKETLIEHCGLLGAAYSEMQRSYAIKRTTAELALIKMMDERLNFTKDSVLSRISKIEEMLAKGIYTAAKGTCAIAEGTYAVADFVAADEEMCATAKSTCAAEEDAEEERIADDEQAAEKERIADDEQAAAKDSSPEIDDAKAEEGHEFSNGQVRIKTEKYTSDGRNTLKTIVGWQEICAKIAVADKALYGALCTGQGYIDGDGNIVVRFANQFMIEMLQSGADAEKKKKIAEAVSAYLNTETDPEKIRYELITEKKNDSGYSIFDEIDKLDMQ